MLNDVLFIGLPYATIIMVPVGILYRYRKSKFTYSSLSSQFLETRQLFWGAMPFHWGILVLFLGHLGAFLFPSTLLAFNGQPLRLLILEATGFALGLIVLFGIVQLLIRRISSARVRQVTTPMDIIVEGVLVAQVVLGLIVALQVRWGSSWFAAVLTPYLRSILLLQPDTSAVNALPWLVKSHILGAYLLFMLVPFSRLAHFLVIPLAYLWRPYQRFAWNRSRTSVRDPREVWTVTRPSNN